VVVEVAASSRAAIAANPSIAGSHGRRKAARVKQQQAEAATLGVRAVGGADSGAASTAGGGQKRRSCGHGSHGRKLAGLKARQQRLPDGSSRMAGETRLVQQPAEAPAAVESSGKAGWRAGEVAGQLVRLREEEEENRGEEEGRRRREKKRKKERKRK